MSKKIGKCALCDDKEIKLVDSHIIPKLVYKRIKSKKNSRFRNYYNIKDIFQDGEKKPMLCASCEKFFNSFETPYANYILDPYIKHGDRRNKIDELLNNYIYSLNWRILYDDLYVFESINSMDSIISQTFIGLEKTLKQYLNSKKVGNKYNFPNKRIKNYMFYLEDLGFHTEIINYFRPTTFGYCFSRPKYNKYIVFTYYLGIVVATVYTPNVLILNTDLNIISMLKNSFKSKNIKGMIRSEMIYQLEETIKQKNQNNKILKESGLLHKLKKRYNIGDGL